MQNVLFLAHTEADGTLAKPALEALGTAANVAAGLGGSLVAGLIGENVKAAAGQIGGCGAARFLGVAGPDFAQSRYGSDAAPRSAIHALIRGRSIPPAAAQSPSCGRS